MLSPAVPHNEEQRQRKLDLYRVVDTPPEEVFDRITRIVAEVIDVPIALVSLVDRGRQWFKSRHGLDAPETPREISFCGHTILSGDILEIEDASKDVRFRDNPLVTGGPAIRFYAGATLRTPDGFNLGTLCAIDRKPRRLSPRFRQLLRDMAMIVVDELELRVALRAALAESARKSTEHLEKDAFFTSVTHELRTPLTSIRGSLGLIEGGAVGPVPEAMQSLIAVANRNVNSLLDLINDLLDVQRLDFGKMDFDFGIVDAAQLLRETCEEMQGVAAQRNVRLDVQAAAVPAIAGDRNRLRQVLANLLSNAVKFSPDGGVVTVRLGEESGSLRFSIDDRGPGIPEAFRSRIFGRFSQAPGDARNKGSGLGLAISKAIVEAHNGRIGFDSTVGAGSGTTFHVTLPLRQTTIPADAD